MSRKRILIEYSGYTEKEVAEFAAKARINRAWWLGLLTGALAMAVLDLTDIHVCVGECDGAGYDIEGPRR